MTRFAVVLAAAAMLLAAPTLTTPAAADPTIKLAQADLNIRLGGDGVRVRSGVKRRGHEHYGYRQGRHRDRCSTTVVIRDGRRTTIRKCR